VSAALLVFARGLRRGLGLPVWAGLLAAALGLATLAFAQASETSTGRYELATPALAWLPILPPLLSGLALLSSWPALSPGQSGFRAAWLVRGPIPACRVAAFGAAWLAQLVLLGAAGLLLAGLIALLSPTANFAHAERLPFVLVQGMSPWLAQPGDFQELRVPATQEPRSILFEPRSLMQDSDRLAPVELRAVAYPYAAPDAPQELGSLELADPDSSVHLELPADLRTPCAIRLVRVSVEPGFATSPGHGRATLEAGRPGLLRAGLELSLQHLAFGFLSLGTLLLVARFAPPGLHAAGWLVVLPSVVMLPGMQLPELSRSLQLGHLPSWSQLSWAPVLAALLALLLAQLPARPRGRDTEARGG
jgi:hypothetical protein